MKRHRGGHAEKMWGPLKWFRHILSPFRWRRRPASLPAGIAATLLRPEHYGVVKRLGWWLPVRGSRVGECSGTGLAAWVMGKAVGGGVWVLRSRPVSTSWPAMAMVTGSPGRGFHHVSEPSIARPDTQRIGLTERSAGGLGGRIGGWRGVIFYHLLISVN